MTAADVADLLRGASFNYRDEDQLQAGLDALLRDAGHTPRREVRISPTDRLDLLVDDVCVEVKLAGTVDRLASQLRRYACSDLIGAFVVVSTRARHRTLPAEIGGKPLTVVHLGGVG